MAEILIRAKNNWMDNYTATEISAVGQVYWDSRIQLGDIIMVRPDGWTWGQQEKFPDFILIKIPGISDSTVKKYEDAWSDVSGILQRACRYNIKSTFITPFITANQGVVTITMTTFNNNVVDKTI